MQDPSKRLAERVIDQNESESHRQEDEDEEGTSRSKKSVITMSLNSTSEFCRSLGEIPTYGMAGNRPEEEEEELMVIQTEIQ